MARCRLAISNVWRQLTIHSSRNNSAARQMTNPTLPTANNIFNVEMLNLLAAAHNGRCLATEYINARTKYPWKCELGHEWLASSDSIKRGSWCKSCRSRAGATKFRTPIVEYQKIANSRGGRCLSKSIQNKESKLEWECRQGHKWFATGGSVKNGGTWCATCSGRAPINLQEMIAIAHSRGGECLSTTYGNNGSKLRWICGNGHQWYASANSVKNNGSWCKIRSSKISGLKKRDSIDEMQRIALQRGGKCLSSEYEGQKNHLLWQCEYGHQWSASPSSVKGAGSWCSVCSGNKRLSIEDLQSTALSRGGKLISTTVMNTEQLLVWECSNGHRWEAKSSNIRFGKWCPHCQTYLGESIVRAVFEQLTGMSFPKVRPAWLVNTKTGKRLEIDGFCEELAIGFEHHGSQHYNLRTHFISEKNSLEDRKLLDELKLEICRKKGISILVVPEVPLLTNLAALAVLVKSFLKHKHVEYKADFIINNLNINTLHHDQAMAKIRAIIEAKGGRLLSTSYSGSSGKLEVECSRHHTWHATAYHLKIGQWCKRCAGLQKGTIDEMNALAEERGGSCLSVNYVSGKKNLLWRCKVGHEWSATPSSIKNAQTWCPRCAGLRKLTIDDMRRLAESKGGICHSESYINKDLKLKWQCINGHTWEATGGSVRNGGSWCPVCAKRERGSRLSGLEKL